MIDNTKPNQPDVNLSPAFWLVHVSGANSRVARKLLSNDQSPYRKIGLLNVLIFVIFLIALLFATGVLHPNPLLPVVVTLIVAAGLLAASSQMIKKISYESTLLFLFVALLVNASVGFCFWLIYADSVRQANRQNIEKARTSLAADTSQIVYNSIYEELERDTANRNALRNRSLDTLTRDQVSAQLQRHFRPYTHFLTIASSLQRELPLPDSVNLQGKIDQISANISDLGQDMVEKVSDSYKLQRNLGAFDNATLDDLKEILSYFNDNLFDRLPLGAKMRNLFAAGANGMGITVFCIAFLLMIIPFSLVNATIRANANDFYHRVLTQIEQQEAEGLEAERRRIADEFRFEAEIRSRDKALEEARNEPANSGNTTRPGDSSTIQLSPELLFENAGNLFQQKNFDKALEYVNKAIELDDRRSTADAGHIGRPEYFQLKARILGAVSDPLGSKEALDRFAELDEEQKYRANLSREILLDRIQLANLAFFGTLTWRLTPGINILLGKNGYGKSHLLRLIVALLYSDKTKIRDWMPANAPVEIQAKAYILSDHPIREDYIAALRTQRDALLKQRASSDTSPNELSNIEGKIDEITGLIDAEQRRILASKGTIQGTIGRVPLLAIPDSRFIDRSESHVTNIKVVSEDLVKDGAAEFLYGRPFGPIINKGLFIVAQKNNQRFDQEPYNLIQRVISELADPGKPKSTDEKNPQPDPNPKKEKKTWFEFVSIKPSSTTGDYQFIVRSEENQEPVLLQSISQGTFSILSICLLIYRFLDQLRPQSADPKKEKAIVLIDEIDAHLHPSWEQKIIGILRREFPNVQFIITAHSPLIVAGCLEGEVSVIRHSETGFTLEQSTDNFIGASTPELFKRMFEIEDKDFQYRHYAALSQKEPELEAQVARIQQQRTNGVLSEGLSKEMDQLYKDLNYIRTVKAVQEREADESVLKTENVYLKSELQNLKNQQEKQTTP